MKNYLHHLASNLHKSAPNPKSAFELSELTQTPIIWLLGKTGAGKSSLVQALTHSSAAEIGNGFVSCTRSSQVFNFPTEQPLVKFLDTRGLGEIDYDPSDDLELCLKASHIVFIVARVDDPVQQDISRALKRIKKYQARLPIVVIHSGADLLPEAALKRAAAANQHLFESALGKPLPQVQVAMPQARAAQMPAQGIDQVIDHIAQALPEVALLFIHDQIQHAEQEAFKDQRSTVIRFASAASSCDLAPVVGAFGVPTAQALMLSTLAKAYDVAWTKQHFREFSAALGIATLARFGGSYLSRQLTKLVPGIGQTVGAISAGAISFAASYALGRSAAFYLYHIKHNKPVNRDQLRALYKTALTTSSERLQRSPPPSPSPSPKEP